MSQLVDWLPTERQHISSRQLSEMDHVPITIGPINRLPTRRWSLPESRCSIYVLVNVATSPLQNHRTRKCGSQVVKRLTSDEIRALMRPVLMRYTPHQLKLTPIDKLLDELAARFDHADVLSFTVPGAPPQAHPMDPERAAAIKRNAIRTVGLEKALREAVMAILAVAEVRQF